MTPQDRLSITEFADLFGLTPEAVQSAVEKNRRSLRKPFYTIAELATRWNISRASVYAILRDHSAKILNMGVGKTREKKMIPLAVVERIEAARTSLIAEPEAAVRS